MRVSSARKKVRCAAAVSLMLVMLMTISVLPGCGAKKAKTTREKGMRTAGGLTWPNAYRDNRLTGESPYNGPETNAVKWVFEAGAVMNSWAVLGKDGTVIAGCEGRILGVNPGDGKLAWEFPTGASPAKFCRVAEDGTIYASAGNKVYALTSKGTEKWSFDVGSKADSPALAGDGAVYAGSLGGRLVALSASGKLTWEFKAAGSIHSPSLDDKGNLYAGGAPLILYALDKNGNNKWGLKPEGELQNYEGLFPWVNCMSSPSIGEDGTLYSGSQVTPGVTQQGQQIPGYSFPDKGKLYAVSPQGQKKWEYASGTYATMTPTIGADGTLYAGTSVWKVVALNPDGTVKWEFNTGETTTCPFVNSPPIVKNGLLYAATASGKLFCITLDGKERWRFAAEAESTPTQSNNFFPPAVGDDGTVFATLYQGRVYSFGTAGAR